MEDFSDIDLELARFLLECAEEKRYTWTYAEVAEVLSRRLNRPVNAHFHLNHPLGKMVWLCFDAPLSLRHCAAQRDQPADHWKRLL